MNKFTSYSTMPNVKPEICILRKNPKISSRDIHHGDYTENSVLCI